ncbi:MAG: hypothetical protein QOE35_1961 [Actinomycetota bacterium]|jgi:hypothetical protein
MRQQPAISVGGRGGAELVGLIEALHSHNHRMAALLDGLDGLPRSVGDHGLLVQFRELLRADDHRLRQLVNDLGDNRHQRGAA